MNFPNLIFEKFINNKKIICKLISLNIIHLKEIPTFIVYITEILNKNYFKKKKFSIGSEKRFFVCILFKPSYQILTFHNFFSRIEQNISQQLLVPI